MSDQGFLHVILSTMSTSLQVLLDEAFQFLPVQYAVDHALGLVLEAQALRQAAEEVRQSGHKQTRLRIGE